MQRALLLCMSVLAVNQIAVAAELRGNYAGTGADTCLYSSLGFNSQFGVVTGSSVWSSSNQTTVVRTFGGHGKGATNGNSMSMIVPPTPGFLPGASSDDFIVSFTYTLSDDVLSTSNVNGTYQGKVLTGSRAGQTYTLSNEPEFMGYISADEKTLVLSTPNPTVEIITYSNGNSFQRICHRSRVLTKLG
jgi:hypothetical protein